MTTVIQSRRGTASTWTDANPILHDGEIGFEHDTNKFKIGDGETAWSGLDYAGGNDRGLVLVDLSGGSHTALPNEISVVSSNGEGGVTLPDNPRDGTTNTVVNSFAEVGSSVLVLTNTPAVMWGWSVAGFIGDGDGFPINPGEAATFRYVASVNTWDRIDSAGSQDTGLITVQVNNATKSEGYGQVEVMPPYNSNQGQFFSQAPPDGGAWEPLQVVAAADLIQANIVQNLNAGLWDDVQMRLQIVVWDLTGANLIVVTTGDAVSVDHTYANGNPLSLVAGQTIGSDLSVTEDGLSITSAAGGVYNVKFTATASWD